MTLDELKSVLRDGGVVGAGGAGFPSYAKLDTKADTLILNCAECEPLLKLHRQVLERYAADILGTLNLVAKTVGATSVIIAVKRSYKRTIDAVMPLIDTFPNMTLCPLPEVYPAGDEVVLIYEATGRVVAPGALPISVGVTVFNVETVYNMSRLLSGGALTHKFVTVAGEVAHPTTLRVPLGTPISLLIEAAGGVTTDHPAYVFGGPMMGRLGSPVEPVTKTTNAVLVLPESHVIVQKKRAKPFLDMKRAMAACCQCHYCTDLCPRHLLGHPIEPSRFMLVASNGVTNDVTPYVNSAFCTGCGLCEMYSCGQGLSPRMLLTACKNSLRQQGVRPPTDAELAPVSEARSYRRVPMRRLMARLGLVQYNKPAPLSEESLQPTQLRLLLSQHIGAPAVPTVAVGDSVSAGQCIAAAAENALSVAIHAPLNGVIESVTDRVITINVKEG
ncbi:MAG: SLBB domain-containing protein [Clostridia bacterium]|nr:SLBB domain-containing protein [Clostridia bacterium]